MHERSRLFLVPTLLAVALAVAACGGPRQPSSYGNQAGAAPTTAAAAAPTSAPLLTSAPATAPVAGTLLPAAAPSAASGDERLIRDRVIDQAAKDLVVPPASVQVLSVEPREWSDTSLGCPRPDQSYAQVITPGYLVRVRAGSTTAEYHTDSQHAVRCSG